MFLSLNIAYYSARLCFSNTFFCAITSIFSIARSAEKTSFAAEEGMGVGVVIHIRKIL